MIYIYISIYIRLIFWLVHLTISHFPGIFFCYIIEPKGSGCNLWSFLKRKNPPTFHYTGWLIGILILVYYNPFITGYYNPLYTLNNQVFFIALLDSQLPTSKTIAGASEEEGWIVQVRFPSGRRGTEDHLFSRGFSRKSSDQFTLRCCYPPWN